LLHTLCFYNVDSKLRGNHNDQDERPSAGGRVSGGGGKGSSEVRGSVVGGVSEDESGNSEEDISDNDDGSQDSNRTGSDDQVSLATSGSNSLIEDDEDEGSDESEISNSAGSDEKSYRSEGGASEDDF